MEADDVTGDSAAAMLEVTELSRESSALGEVENKPLITAMKNGLQPGDNAVAMETNVNGAVSEDIQLNANQGQLHNENNDNDVIANDTVFSIEEEEAPSFNEEELGEKLCIHPDVTSLSQCDDSLDSFDSRELEMLHEMLKTESISSEDNITKELVGNRDTEDVSALPGNGPRARLSGAPRLTRSLSCTATSSVFGSVAAVDVVPAQVKHTRTSRARVQLAHSAQPTKQHPPQSSYRTPLQRKEDLIKELRAQLILLQSAITSRERNARARLTAQADCASKHLETTAQRHRDAIARYRDLQSEHLELQKSHREALRTLTTMERTVLQLRDEMQKQQEDCQAMYLEMYNKGRESAKFERREKIDRMSVEEIASVSPEEMVQHLHLKNQELQRWQDIRRRETYEEGHKLHSTEDATLHFLRDALFHYLTSKRDAPIHLRTMLRIFDYTDAEKKQIAKVLKEKLKKRGKHNDL